MSACLEGIRCPRCDAVFFPVADRCPRCTAREVVTTPLAARGTVETATVGGGSSVGEVRLDDGVLVLAALGGEPVPSVGEQVRYAPVEGSVRFELDGC